MLWMVHVRFCLLTGTQKHRSHAVRKRTYCHAPSLPTHSVSRWRAHSKLHPICGAPPPPHEHPSHNQVAR